MVRWADITLFDKEVLVGCFLMDKVIKFDVMRNVLPLVWRHHESESRSYAAIFSCFSILCDRC